MLLIGLFVSNSLRESAPEGEDWRLFWLHLHMSLGFLLCMVTIARLGWSRLTPPPSGISLSGGMMASAAGCHGDRAVISQAKAQQQLLGLAMPVRGT